MTGGVFSLLEAAEHFKRLAEDYPKACHAALEVAARFVEGEAKSVLGSYKYGWVALKPATIARKATGDSPLLETGELRASITHCSSPTEARVGSNFDRAVWHELGTRKIPPRPFLSEALRRSGKTVVRIIGLTIRDHLAATNLHSDFTRLAFEAVHRVAHELREAGESFVGQGDEDARRRR
jgi:phage gpG-like protein